MKPMTEADIRASLVNAPAGEAERMPIPGLHEVIWEEREFLGWRDPGSPHRGYMVFWRGDEPIGIVLRSAGSSLQAGAAMCSLCHSQQPATQVRMFSVPRAGEAGRAGNSLGTYICSDLACSMLIRLSPTLKESHGVPRGDVTSRAAGLAARLESFTERLLDAA